MGNEQNLNPYHRQLYDHQHAKRKMNGNGLCPPPPKINKNTHIFKKSASPPSPSSSSSSSSSSTSSASTLASGVAAKPQQRHPVIIYTYSPKIIHTDPRDFMALVQKLTGLSRSDNEKQQSGGKTPADEPKKNHKATTVITYDNDSDSSSVITEENYNSAVAGDVQINSCFAAPAPIFDPPAVNPFFNNVPLFVPNPSDFLCSSAPPFYNNYAESLLLMPDVRSSLSHHRHLPTSRE